MAQVQFTVFRGAEGDTPLQSTVTRTLRPNDVHIDITHSGVCGTDLHYRHSDIVLGHEGVGVVRNIGESVRGFSVGDIVGFGCVREVCGHCENCLTGWDQYCPSAAFFGQADFDNGSFAQSSVVDARCVFKIPSSLDPASAAPLMCGGATVWTALSQYVKSTDRVGVMGIGGLGHLAIKMASAMGCEVVGLSSSELKRDEAIKFGAKEFHVIRRGEKLPESILPLNHLLLCGSANIDYTSLVPLMATHGVLYPLTVDFSPSELIMFHLSMKAAKIQGSAVASSTEMRKMLKFCALHGIGAQTEQLPLNSQGIVDALQKLSDGNLRYRAVLVAQT